MRNDPRIGETVSLEFSSADATTAAAMTIKDSNLVTRTLASNERLLIDSLSGSAVANASDPSADIRVSVFEKDGDGTLEANELILSYTVAGVFDGGAEGYSLPVAIPPKVIASGAGAVRVTGMGRIIKDGTIGGLYRPSYRETLTGRGTRT